MSLPSYAYKASKKERVVPDAVQRLHRSLLCAKKCGIRVFWSDINRARGRFVRAGANRLTDRLPPSLRLPSSVRARASVFGNPRTDGARRGATLALEYSSAEEEGMGNAMRVGGQNEDDLED